RISIHADVQETLMDSFRHVVKQLKVGTPLLSETNVGQMINENEAERVESWLRQAVEAGAEILTAGTRNKNIFQPTVLTNVKKGMKVLDEELFAPVVSVSSYKTIEDAIAQVNDSK